jgi:2-polyprenyl-3-methyl-5-hydroxy-6-metoxy-1,4-benzoquinol methylase
VSRDGAGEQGTRLNPDGTDQDDWDEHWDSFGEISKRNPANLYRHAMILRLLGPLRPGSVLLDIGSGQGQFANDFQRDHPDVRVFGVEYSSEGVRRANDAAAREGLETRFIERNLLEPVSLAQGQPAATHALCSEVLEHVEDPVTLVRESMALLAPGAKVVVTVPGGPRTAFDKHIGHFRHFTADALHGVLTEGGLDVDRVLRTGFPFFNLYKLSVMARGERLVREVQSGADHTPSRLEAAASSFFRQGFKVNRDNSRFGWQMAAVAHVPPAEVDTGKQGI